MKAFFAGISTAAVVAAIGYAIVIFWPLLRPAEKPAEVSVPATPTPEVRKAPTRTVQVSAPVRVYEDASKYKLKLPEPVAKSEAQHVLAATQVRGSDRPQTVTTVIDEKTGESQTFVKTDPYPWLALERKLEVRMAYGYRFTPNGSLPSIGNLGNTVKPVGRLTLTYDALRVKALTVGASAHVDTDGQAFVGVGVAYRW